MIDQIIVDNFRSLKDVEIPGLPMAFFCGPNGSGKTNVAEGIDFLAKAFANDLPYAVAEKGGFFNMCYRKERRSRGGIYFAIRGSRDTDRGRIKYEIAFSLRTKGETIRADFYIDTEVYRITYSAGTANEFEIHIERNNYESRYVVTTRGKRPVQPERIFDELFWLNNTEKLFSEFFKPEDRNLLYPKRLMNLFPSSVGLEEPLGMRVYRLSPRYASAAGAPSVSGQLGKYGENLASALDHLMINDREGFQRLKTWVQDVIPDLVYLKPDYTQTRQMGLFVQERGFGTQWYSEELSDGTLMSIALFLAILDKRNSLVFIEEPENSLHPWILQTFLQCSREASKERQILLSTQSPLVVATAKPEQLFLVERSEGRTHITPAIEREPQISEIINKKYLDLGAYWVSGGLRAVPTPSDDAIDSLFDPLPEEKGE